MSLSGVKEACNLLLQYNQEIGSVCEKNGNKRYVRVLNDSCRKINKIFKEVNDLNTTNNQKRFCSEGKLESYYKKLAPEMSLYNVIAFDLRAKYSDSNLEPGWIFNFHLNL